MTQRLLITGAAGRIATALRTRLPRPGRLLRLVDVVEPAPLRDGEEFRRVELTDLDSMTAACRDVDLVVHLGGLASERAWADIVHTNITGTFTVLEAAHRARVRRVLCASSIHAVGFVTASEAAAAEVLPPRPDTLYGVGKVTGEALASVYADRYAMTIVSARIANFTEAPSEPRGLALWFSPGDAARLVEAVAVLDRPGHHIVWGVSRNTRGFLPLRPGERIGFVPRDDAEVYAAAIRGADASQGKDRAAVPGHLPLGGGFVDPDHPLGIDWSSRG